MCQPSDNKNWGGAARARRRYFSLVELLTSMAVLSVIMLALMNFFSAAQSAWTSSAQRSEIFENANIAFDIIGRDLQCSVTGDYFPFYHYGYASDSDSIAFISTTSLVPKDDFVIPYFEVQYRCEGDERGWLRRSCTGDTSGDTCRLDFYVQGEKLIDRWITYNSVVFGHNWWESRADYENIIPGVADLRFNCYDEDFKLIGTSTEAKKQKFPTFIEVEMTLMDDEAYARYKTLPPGAKTAFRAANGREFTKTFYLGDRIN